MSRRSSDHPFGRGHLFDDRLRTRPASRGELGEETRGTADSYSDDSDDDDEEASLSRSSSRSTEDVAMLGKLSVLCMDDLFMNKSVHAMDCHDGAARLSRSGTSPSESFDSIISSFKRSNDADTSPPQEAVAGGTAQFPSGLTTSKLNRLEKVGVTGTCSIGCGHDTVGLLKVEKSISRSSITEGGRPKLGLRCCIKAIVCVAQEKKRKEGRNKRGEKTEDGL